MEREFKKMLSEYGLSDNEVTVFLATLDVSEGSAAEIAKTADFNRVTTYEILKRLLKKGLVKVKVAPRSGAKIFYPQNISELQKGIDEKMQTLSSLATNIGGIKKWYENKLKFPSAKPEIEFIEGKEGLRKALMRTLDDNPAEVKSISSMEDVRAAFGAEFLDTYWARRIKLGIHTRGIVPGTKDNRQQFGNERNVKELRRIKFTDPNEMAGFDDHVGITDQRVCILSLEKGNEHAIIIESRHVAKSWKTLFEMLWRRV